MLTSLLLAACAQPADTAVPAGDSGAVEAEEGELEAVFSFALIADPHVTGAGEHDARLQAAVAAVEGRVAADNIELVFVLGDIAWGGGYDLAHAALSELSVPWVPVQGDNPIQVGEESGFEETFAAQLDSLSGQVDGWTRAPVPVYNPEYDADSWLQNARLDHRGVRFVALDWNSRVVGNLLGETPDLHDFDGGTLPFLADALDTLPDGPDKRVVLMSHMAPFPGPGGLTTDEQDDLIALIQPQAEAVWGNHAGHLHADSRMTWEDIDFQIVTTDATWDDENLVRVVTVWSDGQRFDYEDVAVIVE